MMTILTPIQTIIIVGMVVLSTVITRFLPFFLLSGKHGNHPFVVYLGKVLPYSAMGLLLVYCLKDVNLLVDSSVVPAALSCFLIVILHSWKRNVLLSIGAGTLCYMVLLQLAFS